MTGKRYLITDDELQAMFDTAYSNARAQNYAEFLHAFKIMLEKHVMPAADDAWTWKALARDILRDLAVQFMAWAVLAGLAGVGWLVFRFGHVLS